MVGVELLGWADLGDRAGPVVPLEPHCPGDDGVPEVHGAHVGDLKHLAVGQPVTEDGDDFVTDPTLP